MENSEEGKPVNQQGIVINNSNLSDPLIKLLYSDANSKHNNQANKAINESNTREFPTGNLAEAFSELKKVTLTRYDKEIESIKWQSEEKSLLLKRDFLKMDASKLSPEGLKVEEGRLKQNLVQIKTDEVNAINKVEQKHMTLNSFTLEQAVKDPASQDISIFNKLKTLETRLMQGTLNNATLQAENSVIALRKEVTSLKRHTTNVDHKQLLANVEQFIKEVVIVPAQEPEKQMHEPEILPTATSELPQMSETKQEQEKDSLPIQDEKVIEKPEIHTVHSETISQIPEFEMAKPLEAEETVKKTAEEIIEAAPQMAHAEINHTHTRQDITQENTPPSHTTDRNQQQVFGVDRPDAPVIDPIVSGDYQKEMVLFLQAQAELLQERIKIGEKLLKEAPLDSIILDRKSKKAKVDELAGIKKTMGEDVQYLNAIQAILQDKNKLAEYIEANGPKDKSNLSQNIDQLKKHRNEIVEKTNELKNIDYKDLRYRWYHMFKRPSFYVFLGRQAAWATPFLVAPAISGYVASTLPELTLMMNGAEVTTAIGQAVVGTYFAQKVLFVGPKLAARGMDKLSRVTREKFPRAAERLDKAVDKVQAKTVTPIKDKVVTPIKNRVAHTRATISKHVIQPITTKLGPRATKLATTFKKVFHIDGSKNFTPEQLKLRNKGFNPITGERLSRKMRAWNLTKRGLNYAWRHKIKIGLIVGLTVGAVFTAGALVPAGLTVAAGVSGATLASAAATATIAAASTFAICGAVLLADKLAFKPFQKFLVRREVRKRENVINQRFEQDKEKGQHQTLNQENKEKIVEIAKLETKEQVVTQEKTPEPVRNEGIKTMSEQVQVDSTIKRVEPVSTFTEPVSQPQVQKPQEVKMEQPQAGTSQSKTEVTKMEMTKLSQPKAELRSFADLKNASVEKANLNSQKNNQSIQLAQEEQKKRENEKSDNTKKKKDVQPVLG